LGRTAGYLAPHFQKEKEAAKLDLPAALITRPVRTAANI